MADDIDRSPKSVWHGGRVVLDDLQVSQDAADFIALYGTHAERIRRGFEFVLTTLPAEREDLVEHWKRVAARVGEMVAAKARRPN